ncbi:MAG: hypothetical protein ACLS9T_09560 [Streptococcus salivarius]
MNKKIDGKKYDVEKDVYATVKKDKNLRSVLKMIMSLSLIMVLKTVSPNIKATSVKATKIKGWFDFQEVTRKINKTSNKHNCMPTLSLISGCYALSQLYVLYLIYLNEKGRRQKVKERRQARQMNN